MDWEPVEIGQELRCGDWTRRASDSSGQSILYHLKYTLNDMKLLCDDDDGADDDGGVTLQLTVLAQYVYKWPAAVV